MTEHTKQLLRSVFRPLVGVLLTLNISADAVTIAGLILSIASGYLLSRGWFGLGGLALLLAGLSDSLDGELARRSGRAHRLGAFLDSSSDRLSEFAEFFGLFWFYSRNPQSSAANLQSSIFNLQSPISTLPVLIFAALFASVAVSYVRARAEGIGIECKIGIFERPVRFLFLVLGVFFHRYLNIALWIVLVGSAFTVVQRIVHVLREARRTEM